MPRVTFGKKVKTETPHEICPKVEDVFAHNVEENGIWFLPLLTVDMNGINPDWHGKAHFLYHEANRTGGVTFRLSGDKYLYEWYYHSNLSMYLSENRLGTPKEVPFYL